MVMSRRVFLQALAGTGAMPWRSPQPLTMQLDWHLNAQFAGLCVADARGEYRRNGLAVNLKAASADMDVVQTVMSQPHTLGCAEESLILTAQARGISVVAIAAMLQASPLSLMSLPAVALDNLQQLSGKRVGVHSDGRQALEFVLAKSNISLRPAKRKTTSELQSPVPISYAVFCLKKKKQSINAFIFLFHACPALTQ